ncbi:50S ribosomal protein L25 [Candidatus Roizmanbacteria bacterium]|nr:50S ribosomal protein L25 [Candidatus Roizmanbacteria bacterium]
MSNQKLPLAAEERTVFGKQVNQLRKNNILPGNIYGIKKTSQAISLKELEFKAVYKVARETGVVHIELDKTSIPTLITDVQRDPVTHAIVHIDFRRVNLKQKIQTMVPVLVVGESEAVKTLGGVLLNQHDHITIEAFPQDIPSHIEVDITSITELGQEIKISDLTLSEDYTVIDLPETVIVTVTAHKVQSEVPDTAAATPEEGAEATEAVVEGEEGSESASAAQEPTSSEQ